MAHADPYADIDFDEITEQTGLAGDEIKCLKVSFYPSRLHVYYVKNVHVLIVSFSNFNCENFHIFFSGLF